MVSQGGGAASSDRLGVTAFSRDFVRNSRGMVRRRNLFEVGLDAARFPRVAHGLTTLGWRAQSLRD
jgi:hypothetical protein